MHDMKQHLHFLYKTYNVGRVKKLKKKEVQKNDHFEKRVKILNFWFLQVVSKPQTLPDL